jgi:hypothetical protein
MKDLFSWIKSKFKKQLSPVDEGLKVSSIETEGTKESSSVASLSNEAMPVSDEEKNIEKEEGKVELPNLSIPVLKGVNLDDLVPSVLEKLKVFYYRAQLIGIPVIVTSIKRNPDEQKALYAQGRENLEKVNQLRAEVGLYKLKEEENKFCVTWTIKSYHIIDDKHPKARAFDIAILKEGKAVFTKVNVNKNEENDYLELAKIGKSVGLVCGANWKKPDYCHFQES